MIVAAPPKENNTLASVQDEKGLSNQTTYNGPVVEIALSEEKIQTPIGNEDFEVDITQLTRPMVAEPSGVKDPDETEHSSSFGDTASRTENASGTSDAEVESEFCGDNALATMFCSYDGVLPARKKKVTNHWRRFIRPLMWRCKWTELKMKELEAQAKMYSRELEINDQTKMVGLDEYTSEFCSKSSPFTSHCFKRKSMKRRKRKQLEKRSQLTSFTSQHCIFSYLENRKSDMESTSTADDAIIDSVPKHDEFALNDEWFRGDETLLEQILSKIETAHAQVFRIRNHLDTVMLKNGMKYSSSENLSLISPCDMQTSSAYSPAISAGNEDAVSIGAIYTPQQLSELGIGDLALPEVSPSCAMVAEIPDIIESTVGLLSAAEVTVHQSHVESADNIMDDALLQNEAAQDSHPFDGINDESFDMELELHLQLESDEHNSSYLPLSDIIPDPDEATDTPEEKPTLTSCLTSELRIPKAKRGERKAGPCGWNL